MRKILALVLLCSPVVASAHITVSPRQSSGGAHEKYEIRVPNEKDVDTLAVEVRFPAGLRVRSVEQKAGWRTVILRGATGELTGVRWTGDLPPQQFTEFGILAANPNGTSELTFPATQIFADGTRIEWSGTALSRTPAPRVMLSDKPRPTMADH